MSNSIDLWLRYARAHHIHAVLAALMAVIACDIAFGSARLDFPFADTQGSGNIPLRHVLPLALAVISAGSLNSAMRPLEEVGSTSFRLVELSFLIGAILLAAAMLAVAEFFISPVDVTVRLLRSLLIWSGIALLSGRLFGWRLGWVFPLLSLLPLTYWQKDASGNSRWWDWTNQPGAAMPCWGIAVISLIVGGAALALSPWRVARLRNSFSGRARNP
ncbi:hypothetical protein AB0O07_16405 [Streptomyces sp. NPDC093085]|uniref:hypothetical protein n=1 Tax=Streptomyces sp. NPDC093085 TaxID=3155068 RepID=UPI0034188C02